MGYEKFGIFLEEVLLLSLLRLCASESDMIVGMADGETTLRVLRTVPPDAEEELLARVDERARPWRGVGGDVIDESRFGIATSSAGRGGAGTRAI